ncbi:hypothetical protein AVEN_158506-1 [Araneus ventricosus]|uniref:Uncharacterized protein n=1 Tax=Araneus ventricosus TaxID=182803 RepID=A0A4Y2JJA6_ARAVE|nr:hypothetical protein AVEN_158506-1 [Araneus ventricosus]
MAVIRKETVQNVIIFWKIGREDIIKCGNESTALRRACMNISHRREELVDSNLKFSVREEFVDDDCKIVREFEINKFRDKAFVQHAVEGFLDIQEDSSCIQFGAKPVHNFVGNSQKLMSAAMA